MTALNREPLCDRVLLSAGIPHGFGQKSTQVPDETAFPKQVHGADVLESTGATRSELPPQADAIWTRVPGHSVGIVTADCVPVLIATPDASAVCAIHAGWRGLAAGVVEAGLAALAEGTHASGAFGAAPGDLIAAIGPAARGCCYEVDEPVRQAMAERYPEFREEVLKPGRAGHFQFDPPLLVERALQRFGVEATRIGTEHRVCTICDPDRFESYRRDGAAAGRLEHFITKPRRAGRRG